MIEIYYIPEEVRRCYSCVLAKELAALTGLETKMYPIMEPDDSDAGFKWNMDTIHELMRRKETYRSAISYPQVFIDGIHIGSTGALRAYIEDVLQIETD